MPAGSGPQAVALTAAAVGTAEAVIATMPPGNWNTELGTLLEFQGFFNSPATSGSLVLKLRQGTTTAGTQVGSTASISIPVSASTQVGAIAFDTSAFGLLQQGGQYCMTAQYAAATGGTLTGVLTQETVAPVQ